MSKPTPAHYKTVDIPLARIARGYARVMAIRAAGPGLWSIVAAASTLLTPEEEPPAEGWIRVIVAPARVAP